jgi:hypothetical protein
MHAGSDCVKWQAPLSMEQRDTAMSDAFLIASNALEKDGMLLSAHRRLPQTHPDLRLLP